MFRAIGFLIILWGLSQFFSTAFVELDTAAAKSFHFIGVAAEVSESQLQELSIKTTSE